MLLALLFSQISTPKLVSYHAYFNVAVHSNALHLREGQEAVP